MLDVLARSTSVQLIAHRAGTVRIGVAATSHVLLVCVRHDRGWAIKGPTRRPDPGRLQWRRGKHRHGRTGPDLIVEFMGCRGGVRVRPSDNGQSMRRHDMDLATTYLGLSLRNPLVASASPLSQSADRVIELVEAGVSAVVLPSLFEEQIEHPTPDVDLPHFFDNPAGPGAPGRYLDLIEECAKS